MAVNFTVLQVLFWGLCLCGITFEFFRPAYAASWKVEERWDTVPKEKVEVKSLAKVAVQAGGLNVHVILHRLSVCRPRYLHVWSNDFFVYFALSMYVCQPRSSVCVAIPSSLLIWSTCFILKAVG